MTGEFIREAHATLKGLVCEHMPATAAASGFVSAVPLSKAWVAEQAAAFEATGREARLSYVQEWLGERGGKQVARAIREEVILRALRRESEGLSDAEMAEACEAEQRWLQSRGARG